MKAMIAFLLSSLFALPAHAEDTLAGTRGKMKETGHTVRVVVDRGHARLVVRRTVRAEGDRHDQAIYDLSLPDGSVAVGLRTLGMKDGHPIWYAGDLMEAEAAAAKYKELTGVGGFYPKDPALLSWRGYSNLALQVFPVAPHAEKTVEYSLVLPTQYENGQQVLVLGDLGLAAHKPTLLLETARPADRLWVNGQPYPSGTTMPWPGTIEDGGPGDRTKADSDATGAAELRIVLVPAAAPKLGGRLATVPLSKGGGLVHFRVEAARHFSQAPRGAAVVILVDKSYSVSKADRAAGLVAMAPVLRRLPDARVAVLAFDRKVAPLWPGFLPTEAALERLTKAEIEPGNGSQIDDALRAAGALLTREARGRERRVYLLSDLLTRSALAVLSLVKPARASTAVLHVGVIGEGDPALDPTEDTPWAKVARATGGLCWHGEARANADNLDEVFEEWVRPTRLHHFALDGFAPGTTNRQHAKDEEDFHGSDDDESRGDLPAELVEGAAYEYGGLPFTLPRRIVVRGELWSRPVRLDLTSTADEERLWSALVFGTHYYTDLSEREMMTLALRGRAVSPVTSYLAIEPGVRPSTEGLEEASGVGGLGSATMGLSGSGMGYGGIGSKFDPEAHLRGLLREARESCKVTEREVAATIETTVQEIVDVPAVTITDQRDVACLREAIWSWQLPDEFNEDHATYRVTLAAERAS